MTLQFFFKIPSILCIFPEHVTPYPHQFDLLRLFQLSSVKILHGLPIFTK